MGRCGTNIIYPWSHSVQKVGQEDMPPLLFELEKTTNVWSPIYSLLPDVNKWFFSDV